MNPQARPGWYQDHLNPHGLRYWDGQQWTASVAPKPDLGPPSPTRTLSPRTSRRHGLLTWAGGTLSAIVVLGLVISAFDSPTDSDGTKSEAAKTSTTRSVDEGEAEVTPSSEPSAEPTEDPEPVITFKTVTKKKRLSFGHKLTPTSKLAKGVVRVQQAGRPGVRVNVYRQKFKDGRLVGRQLVRTRLTRPVPEIKLRGTYVKPAPRCDPNYSGQCVPITSDVDCGGGSGDGPGYVNGEVRVVGSDIYDLDRDGDGIGCD